MIFYLYLQTRVDVSYISQVSRESKILADAPPENDNRSR